MISFNGNSLQPENQGGSSPHTNMERYLWNIVKWEETSNQYLSMLSFCKRVIYMHFCLLCIQKDRQEIYLTLISKQVNKLPIKKIKQNILKGFNDRAESRLWIIALTVGVLHTHKICSIKQVLSNVATWMELELSRTNLF